MQRTSWKYLLLAALPLILAPSGPVAGQLATSATAEGPALVAEGTFGVLYDQTANQSVNGFSSQDFTDAGGVNDGFDSTATDDFVVPEGQLWDVLEVDVPGFFGAAAPGPVDTVDVMFLADAGGTPGAVQCAFDDLVPAMQAAGSMTIALPSPCTLSAGVAWLSVQAAAPAIPNGQWFWFLSSVQTGAGFFWRNPADGFATGCTTFMPALGCGAADPDLSFVLRGTERVDIPTLGGWGMMLFAVGLAILSLAVLRRRFA